MEAVLLRRCRHYLDPSAVALRLLRLRLRLLLLLLPLLLQFVAVSHCVSLSPPPVGRQEGHCAALRSAVQESQD